MSAFGKYFRPEVLSKISRLELRARHVVEGFVSGMHRSPYKGFSVEFASHRAYAPGDDIRHIDWRVYGKADRFFIKEYEEETNMRVTLRQHYRNKRRHYGVDYPNFYDRDLRRLFSDAPEFANHVTAAQFISRIRRQVRRVVAGWTGIYQYTIDQVLEEMIGRCRELKLRLAVPEEQARQEFTVLLTVQAMNYLHSGGHRLFL